MTLPEAAAFSATAAPILCVVGARPNYMKMAPILRACAAQHPPLATRLVHTGQHYDRAMSERLFADLGLPAPDVNLEVGSGSHAVQTAEVMKRFEPLLDAPGARAVLVVGDVNSTLACALVAAKRGVPVAHVEAGLRSDDRRMPEELNRVLTDQLADLLYTTERSAAARLAREGNVMIDSLRARLPHAPAPEAVLAAAGHDPARIAHGYAVATLHRPANVDEPARLDALLGALAAIARRLPLALALHPRTRANLERFGLAARLDAPGILVLPPQGYLEMLGLMAAARVVLTDSGGMQEETTALGVPCLTLRENTERPITVEQGSNRVVGVAPAAILAACDAVLAGPARCGRVPELWDGHAATRIAAHLAGWLAERGA